MIIKINDSLYLKFDPATKTSKTIDIEALTERKSELEESLSFYREPSDAELLAWARVNFMSPERLLEKEKIEAELSTIDRALGEINGD